MSPLVELLEAGRAALASGDWPDARRLFEESLVLDETPEGLFGLGMALWWTNEGADALGPWERAYRAFRRNGDVQMAVAAAVQLSLVQSTNFGNIAAASGWAARAERVARNSGVALPGGWALIAKGSIEGDLATAERWAREAQEIAVDRGDRDLEACALALLGSVLIGAGRAADGTALLDEAMAGALGEAEDLDTVVFASCMLVAACYQCADFSRVVHWSADLTTFIERFGSPYVNATCRAHYGAVLVATGDWARAETELAVAIQLAGRSLPAVRAEASAFLAELRLAQGRLDEAAELVAPISEHKVAWPVAAAIGLALHDPATVAASVARQADLLGGQHLAGSRLREVLGDARLAAGDVEGAHAVGRDLEDVASTVDCELITARAARLLGRSLAAAGDPEAARAQLAAALGSFDRLEMPLEVARTRIALATTLVASDPAAAEAEVGLAMATFEALGAGRDLAAARARPGPAGASHRDGTQVGMAALTSREREVLALVAEGMSNPEIAERLYLSRRTVEHHVASVLSKLGLRNRTEAALMLRGQADVPFR